MPDTGSLQVHLRFDRPAPTDANLLFGADYVPPRNDLTVQAVLPLPVAAIKFIPPARVELLVQLPALTVSSVLLRPSVPLDVGNAQGAVLPGVVFAGDVRYFSRSQRPTVGQTAHLWQVAGQTEDGPKHGQQDADARPSGWGVPWRRTESLPQGVAHRLPPVLSASREQRRAHHQDATPWRDATWFGHQIATHFEAARLGMFQNASAVRDATHFRHQDGDRSKRANRLSFWQGGRKVTRGQGSDFQSARAVLRGWRGRYQEAVPPPPGISLLVIPVPPPTTPCYTPSTALLFAAMAATDGRLLFICENHNNPPPTGEPVVVPIRRLYFVLNNVTLHRVPDGAEVPVFNLSLSLDAASWTWGVRGVPAGAFAQQGTWIEALAAIAGAAGGYLMPHPTAQSLRVRHRYPVAPWEWSSVTPDFVLPVDAVARESLRWLEKPAYNRVFVSGQDVGVLGQVTRAGTAGDLLAPMVLDALITEAPAARQRGIAVLADTGRQIEVSLRLPVLAETGIIEPGAFVEYQDGSVTRLGLVRATQVQAGFPEVWQTLGVQAYA